MTEEEIRKTRREVYVLVVFFIVSILVVLSYLWWPQPPAEQPEVKYFFSGDSGKVTPIFHIPTKNWKIYFTVQAGDNSFFKFAVYSAVYSEASGVPLAESIDIYNTAVSQMIVDDGPGNFYLVVTSSLAYWEITITSTSE